MVRRTLHFSNPAHLRVENEQLVVELKGAERTQHTVPIEDIGVVIIEHPQITLTSSVMQKLMEAKVALVACNQNYMPSGMFLPFDSNTEQTLRMREQVSASVPLKKQLWQQTIRYKILNQAFLLDKYNLPSKRLHLLEEKVRSGDSTNCEGQAAAYYWSQLYGDAFVRSKDRTTPNAQLNYGYAILRSVVARALTSSGLHPSFGIFHRNKYNAFCLADDIMEPYRPYVDEMVFNIVAREPSEDLTRLQKIELLKIPQIDTKIGKVNRPLLHAVSQTTASLCRCFSGKSRRIVFPQL